MTIEIIQGRYFSAFWFLVAGDGQGDWHGALYQDEAEPDSWHFIYRFRYYVDDDTTAESKDVKNWYAAGFRVRPGEPRIEAEARCEEAVERMAQLLIEKGYSKRKVEKVSVKSADQDTVVQALASAPWSHVSFMNASGDTVPQGSA